VFTLTRLVHMALFSLVVDLDGLSNLTRSKAKDVRRQRLTVCCHSAGLSTKNEQELRLCLESMVK
jgi:hypothetical protein